MFKKQYKRIIALILVFAMFVCAATSASAFFSKDDYNDVNGAIKFYAEEFGWNQSLMDYTLTEWSADFESGHTDPYEAQRGSAYRTEYYYDMIKTTREFLGILDGGNGGSMAALARAEAMACEEEVASGVYNSRQERNGDNNVLYNTWYYGGVVSGDAYPWCCAFVAWCANECGYIDSGLFTKSAGCCTMHNYLVGTNGFERYNIKDCAPFGSTYTPQPGDIMFFWDGGGGWEHIGIVVEVLDDALAVVEGNCSNRVKENHYTLPVINSQRRLYGADIVHVPYPVVEGGADGIFNFLTTVMGLNTAAACGVLANLECESNFQADLYGDYGIGVPAGQPSSYGLCQWHLDRWNNLKNFCSANGYDETTLEGQLYFLQYELQNPPYTGVWSTLHSVSNDAEGAYIAGGTWCHDFEVPAGYGGDGWWGSTTEFRASKAKNEYWPRFSALAAGDRLNKSDSSHIATGTDTIL